MSRVMDCFCIGCLERVREDHEEDIKNMKDNTKDTMMDIEDVRALIVARIQMVDQCNSHFLNHLEGQVRALVAVVTGEPPPSANGDIATYLRAAGIPHAIVKRGGDQAVDFDAAWLRAHGFTIHGADDDPNASIHHPRWSQSW